MDMEKVKGKLQSIIALVESLPEKYQAKAFEVLVAYFFQGSVYKDEQGKTRVEVIELPLAVKGFLQKHNLSKKELNGIILREGEAVEFIKEPNTRPAAKAQISWSLLLALKNALLYGQFKMDPESVRSICQQKGCYDKANFTSIFKKPIYRKYFMGPVEPQGDPQLLSSDGEKALAELITNL